MRLLERALTVVWQGASLQVLRALRVEDGPPLPVGQQLHRLPQLQVLHAVLHVYHARVLLRLRQHACRPRIHDVGWREPWTRALPTIPCLLPLRFPHRPSQVTSETLEICVVFSLMLLCTVVLTGFTGFHICERTAAPSCPPH